MANPWEADYSVASSSPWDAQYQGEPKKEKDASGLGNFARTLAQGAMLGFGDEAEAYVRSAFSDRDQEEILDEIRKDIALYGKQNPKTAMAAELGGALATAFVPFAGATRLATLGAKAGKTALGLGGMMGRGAAVGAAEGGIAGFGVGEGGFSNRVGSATKGALLGGALGGAAPVVAGAVGQVGSSIFDGLGLTGANRASQLAERRVLKSLESEGLNPDQALARMQQARAAGSEIMPADLGEATRGAAYVSQAVPSDRRTSILDTLTERSIAQGENIGDVAAQKLGAEGAFGLDYLDNIYETAQTKFKPLYEQGNIDLPTEPFKKFGNRNIFKEAFQSIQSRADIVGDEAIPDLDKVLSGDVVPSAYLQKIKQGLDRLVNSETDKITGKVSDRGKDIIEAKNQFKDLLHKYNPAYKKADAMFADMSDLRKSFDIGQSYEKMSTQEFKRATAKMNPDQMEALKTGMVTKIRDITSGTDATDYVKRVFGSPKRREALKSAFKDDAKFAEFEQYMKLEASKVLTQRRVLGGSPTDRNMLEGAEQGIDSGNLLQMMMGGKGEVMRQAGGALTTRMRGVGSPVAAQMSDLLFPQGNAAQQAAMKRLTERATKDLALSKTQIRRPELYGGLLGRFSGLNADNLK